ncbi:MAG: glycosyltransferase family 4 protein [Actinobacteria bacterium]|nr:MAG: glycosyltransferase family 4 protein [Actinomycetota bacterium]
MGATFVLRRTAGRDRPRRHCPLCRLPLVRVPPVAGGPRDRTCSRSCPRSRCRAGAARLVGADCRAGRDDGRERLLPDDDGVLLLRVHHAGTRPAGRLRAAAAGRRVKVTVLTSSYPRTPVDTAGRFVADAVERVRERGVDVEVVSPATVRHYGIAYGSGVVGNLRRNPARALLLPLMLGTFRQAARRAARDADLVHAHWLPLGGIAMTLGRPFVVQLWGTDVELARRAPQLARQILRRARMTVCASNALADAAREFGAGEVRVIGSGVDVPDEVGPEAEPPEVLYAGRLSREKGILDLLAAADGMKLIIAGDGPLRVQVPGALGFIPHDQLGGFYERAAMVAVPSHREGFGVVCAEAMAHGRPVVAAAVGGLLDLVVPEETGLLVPPGDVRALRAALRRLLDDEELRHRLGAAARERVKQRFSWQRTTDLTLAAYEDALAEPRK